MRLLALLLLLFSIRSFGSDHFVCINNKLQLEIIITEESEQKSVAWKVLLIDDQLSVLEGTGIWQKESESDDAFSSFDQDTAISFKNQRAVLVLSNDQGIFFPFCKGL